MILVFNPNDHWPQSEGLTRADAEEIYECKYAFAMLLKPQRILELGVRCGYSAQAFLTAVPQAYYLGVDLDTVAHGGVPGSFGWVLETLTELFPEAEINLLLADSHTLTKKIGNFDLVYVDGDHSEEGCLADLKFAAEVSEWILVDDFYHLESVQKAITRFLNETNYPAMLFPTFRGDILIRVNK